MKGSPKGPSGVETTCLRDIKPVHRLTVWPFLVVYSVVLVALALPYNFWSLLLPLFGSDADFYEDFQENFYYGTVAAIPLTGFVQIICVLTTFWSVSYRCALSKRVVAHPWEATSLKVTPKPTKGSPAIVDIQCDTPIGEPYGTGFGTPEGLYYFNFQGRKFMYDKEDGCFKKRKMPVKESLGFYKECRGIQKEEVPELLRTIGKNKFEIPIPTFKELFAEHAVAPFFVFQMFCVLLWCLDEYWYYSLFTGFMLVSFEATIVQQRLRNLASLRSMEVESYNVTVFRDGAWVSISSADLLPLDIMQLTHTRGNQTPCDMLILEGTCVVNEALLTGESTPQMKEGVAKRENGDQLDIKVEDKKHIIWGGTEVMLCQRDEQALDSSNFPKGKGGSACVCVVLRTGFGTSQGSLVRTIVHTTNRVSANSAESLGFICFLLVFALAAAAYVVHRGMDNPEMTAYKMLLNCILIITSVVPPELPMELTLAVNTSLFRLAKKEVFCTEPFRIPFAGALDTCCFDKTGTLTADTMRMRGVAGQGGKQDLKEAKAASEYSHLVMAGCHSLVHLEGELIGDSMEKAALKSIQWECRGTNAAKSAKNPKQHLDILHRHAFSSAKKRMSSLAIDGQGKRLVLCKGAPEVLEGLYDKSTVPDNYKEIFTFYMREGARVIALGHKVLPNGMRKEELPNIPREKAESNLVFDGFAVFDCPLKPDSMRVVHELQDSNHRVVMITGDNQLTAAHVALTLSIVDKAPLFLSIRDVQPDGSGAPVWCDYDGVEVGEQSEVLKHDLCVSGDHLGGVLQHDPNFLKQWVQHIGVFARCTPDQKAIITGTLKDLGRVVSMCGDGTNDVGALKTSHVGIALLNHPDAAPGTVVAPGMGPGAGGPKRPRPIGPPPEGLGMWAKMKWMVEETQKANQEFIKEQREAAAANQIDSGNKPKPKPKPKSAADILQEQMAGMEDVEDRSAAPQVKLGDASIAAPFTSKRSSIQCTADISRLGRCTLVTTLQMYKILALNCLTSAYSMSVLYSDGVKFGEKQMLMSGLVMTACFLLIARSEPLPKLSPQRPHNKVFTVYMMGSILGQFAIHLYTLISVVNLVFSLDPAGASEQSKDLEGEFKPSLLNSIVFLMTTIQQTTTFANNYQGRPWMTGLRDNRPMYWSLAFLGVMTMFIALEVSEDFNSWIEIVPMPSSEFKWSVVFLLVQDVVGVVLIERFFLHLCKDRSYLKMKIRDRQPLPPLEGEHGAPPQPVVQLQ